MKLLAVIVGLVVCTSLLAQKSNKGIFVLAVRTLAGEIKTTDFSDSGSYFITVDTITSSTNEFSSKYSEFKKKKDVVKKTNNLCQFLADSEIISFRELKDNFLYDNKKHWIMKVSHLNKEYIVQWWFQTDDKLEGITLSLGGS